MSPHTTFRSMFLISGASANLSARRRWRIRQRALSVNDRRYVQCEQLWKQAPETERTPWRRQFAKAFQKTVQKSPGAKSGTFLFSRFPLLRGQTLVSGISLPVFRRRQRYGLIEHG